jgi:hypothetical protein
MRHIALRLLINYFSSQLNTRIKCALTAEMRHKIRMKSLLFLTAFNNILQRV